MDNNLIATLVGLGVQTVSTILQTYVTFKKSNIEKYFEMLLQENKDLTKIGMNERLQKNFFLIIDYVSKETTEEKINNWKNLTIKLATTFDEFDFAENYSDMLASLTPFDLTVLFAIYSNDFKSHYFNRELIEFFKNRNVDEIRVFHSIKRLSVHNLVSEESDGMTYLADNDMTFGQKLIYAKNELGKEFIELINK